MSDTEQQRQQQHTPADTVEQQPNRVQDDPSGYLHDGERRVDAVAPNGSAAPSGTAPNGVSHSVSNGISNGVPYSSSGGDGDGFGITGDDDGSGRPSKRRRLTDSLTPQQRPSPRAVSPPWKKFSAEGPTSFYDPLGKRRSGRTNALPLDLQPASGKRRTRASATSRSSGRGSGSASGSGGIVASKYSSTPRSVKREQHDASKQSQHAHKITRSASKAMHTPASKSPRRYSFHSKRESLVSTPARSSSRRKPNGTVKTTPSEGLRHSQRKSSLRNAGAADWRPGRRRSQAAAPASETEPSEEEDSDELSSSGLNDTDMDDYPMDPNIKTPKLKFTVSRPTLGTPSYGNTLRFATDTRTRWAKRQFSSLEDWMSWAVEHGHQIFPGYDVYEGDDEYLKEVIDDYDERRRNREISKQVRGPVASLTRAQAREEAEVRREVEDALLPGGKLDPEICTQLAPEKFDLGRRQYAHWDHVVNHVANFRGLMNKEHRKHRENARRLAYAAAEKWKAIQPKSQHEMEREKNEAQIAIAQATMRQCTRDLGTKWSLIRDQLDKIRLAKWQEEQEALGKKALNKVMERSAMLLDQRRKAGTSELGSDTDSAAEGGDTSLDDSQGSDTDDTDVEGEEEENMSSSGSESEDAEGGRISGDETLTVEELRRKYAEASVDNRDRPPDEAGDLADPDTPGQEPNRDSAQVTGTSPEVDQLSDGEDQDPSEAPEIDERARKLYDAMSEDSDESIDMSEEDPSDEDESDQDSCGSDDSEELGLFSLVASKSQLNEAKAHLAKDTSEMELDEDDSTAYANGFDDDDEELEEVSLIPDAAQVQTPAASNDESGVDSEPAHVTKARQSNLSIVTSGSPEPATPEAEPTETDDLVIVDDAAAQDLPVETKIESQSADEEEIHNLPQDKEASLPATPVSAKAVKTPVPGLLRATLREYQHYGLDWLAGLYAKDTNGILADEMGLGKTIQTISLLAHIAEVHGVWGPHLIVVPTSVMLNWEIEFKKFLPGFKVMVYYGTPEERKNKRRGWLDDDKWNVVITSYQLVLQDQASFKRRGWHYMVLDEAHNIKNWKSARWQTLLGFRTSHRLLLTGTPLQNNLTELWSLMFFLMPYSEDESGQPQFTGLEEFTAWFNKPVNQIMEQGRGELTDEARELVRRLHTILRPYILRRLKADVEKQMPAKYEHVVYCKLSKRQRYLYDGFMSRASTRETLASGNYLSIINCLMQLRKVCNHPDLFETRQIVTSYAMPKSAMVDFEIKDLLVRRRLLQEDDFNKVDLGAINLLPAGKGPVSALDTIQNKRVSAQLRLTELVKSHLEIAGNDSSFDGSSIESSLAFLHKQAHRSAADSLDSHWNLMKMRSQERPLIKQSTIDLVRRRLAQSRITKREITLTNPDSDITALYRYERRQALPLPPRPSSVLEYQDWLDYNTPILSDLTPSLTDRAASMQPLIQRFGCITPAVVSQGVDRLTLGKRGIETVDEIRAEPPSKAIAKIEPFHEAQTRLSIAFPDKRLLQYDCGKLQRLDVLLRTLQAGGHRALIFTQMTKVLDILEQFLNIHGHRYLRLDGSTKIEQRQILTDRFNNDTRILAFILSSRSGGLGINLTGADTVIFYDLDWNPAMDKQCQDRCHRIGQTRDVHIYRFVSEYTIEANILRKANQKRLLDDVIIKDGDFTTDHFNQPNPRDVEEDEAMHEADAEASAAMDRVLGGGGGGGSGGAGGSSAEQISTKLLAHAEDKEDIAAANVAEREGHADDADFNEKPSGTTTRADTPKILERGGASGASRRQGEWGELDAADEAEFFTGSVQPRTEVGLQVFGERVGIGVDRFMLEYLEWELKDVPVVPPDERGKKKKRGRKKEQYHAKKRRR